MVFDLRQFHEMTQGLGAVPGAAPANVGGVLAGGGPPPVHVGPGGSFPGTEIMESAVNIPGTPTSGIPDAEPNKWGAALSTMFGDPQNVGVMGAGALHLMGQPERAQALMGLTQSYGAGQGAKATLTPADADGDTSTSDVAGKDGRIIRTVKTTLPRDQGGSGMGGPVTVPQGPQGPGDTLRPPFYRP